MAKVSAAALVCLFLTGVMGAVGCSSAEAPVGDGCVGSGSEALKTCAKGTTLSGVDVSSYQGTVSWSKVKGAGTTFAFARISDGLNSVDSKFAQNWPAMKAAGIVRGSYQYFRPGQDAGLQAQMVIDKLAAAGGLQPGDLPPVLDLETADGLAASVVVTKAKAWLAKVEAATKVKPIVYTAAFMSNVIGTSFGGYTLWVANYQTTCPTMPSGWTDWQFWQHSDSGTVAGISGGVDSDYFNGTLAQLNALTVAPASAPQAPRVDMTAFAGETDLAFGGNKPKDGSEGATLGDGNAANNGSQTESATVTPCR